MSPIKKIILYIVGALIVVIVVAQQASQMP